MSDPEVFEPIYVPEIDREGNPTPEADDTDEPEVVGDDIIEEEA